MTKEPATGTVPHDFANFEIASDSLPAVENMEWQSLHPRFVRRLQASALIWTLVFGAIGTAVHIAVASGAVSAPFQVAPWLFPAAWTIYAVLSLRALLWPIIAAARRGYAIRGKDIFYRSGVFWRSAWAVPFNRVQHTQIDSTPLDRCFGLVSLSVFPAGGGAQKIPGLGEAVARRLRTYISARIEEEERLNRATQVGDTQVTKQSPASLNEAPATTPAEPTATMETQATDRTGDDTS